MTTTLRTLTADDTVAVENVRQFFRNYAAWLGVDLSFQGFEEEMASLPGAYSAPGGRLFYAERAGQPAGCVGIRPFSAGLCEMKRLYVRPEYRGLRLGRMLAEGILDAARIAGYDSILLDTLDDMESARALYQELGFEEIPPYYYNPIAGAHYLKADL